MAKQQKQFIPLIGGVAGAIAGAAIGVGVAAAMKDEKNWESLKEEAIAILKDLREDEELRDKVKARIVRGGKLLQKRVKEVREE